MYYVTNCWMYCRVCDSLPVSSDYVWHNALGHRGAERVMRIREKSERLMRIREKSERVMRIRKRSERVIRIRERMCSNALGHILSYVLSCVWLFACVTRHTRMHESRHTYEWVMWNSRVFCPMHTITALGLMLNSWALMHFWMHE